MSANESRIDWDLPSSLDESRRGTAVLVTGPSGAGKTTTGLLWALARHRATYALDLDAVRSVLLAGDRVRDCTSASDVVAEYALAARTAAEWAANVTSLGVDAVLIGGRLPHPPFEDWRRCWEPLDLLEPLTVVLLPSLKTCIARNAHRTALGHPAITEAHIRLSHGLAWSEWAYQARTTVIDTSHLSQSQTIDALESFASTASATNGTPAHGG